MDLNNNHMEYGVGYQSHMALMIAAMIERHSVR